MDDVKQFNKAWNEFSGFSGIRGEATRKRYEEILFSIWKHHNRWDTESEDEGFPVKSYNRTYNTVIKLAENAGLLIKTRNYSVGNHPRYFKKNDALFDYIFRSGEDKFNKWLKDENRYDPTLDLNLTDIENLDVKQIASSVSPKQKKKAGSLSLCYDIDKLYKISNRMLSRYYKLMRKLDKAAIHKDLRFQSFLRFNADGLPSGRPVSYFCFTLNPKKQHKNSSRMDRNEFLKMIGLPDYYEVFDIKSEVPRVNYLFHTGEWKPDSYDFYTEILKEAKTDQRYEEKITRDVIKSLFMRFYFGKTLDKRAYLGGYVKTEAKKRPEKLKIDLIDDYGNKTTGYYDLRAQYEKDAKRGDIDIDYDLYYDLGIATENVVKPSIKALIFWYTFFLETEVKIELLNQGKIVYNVFDGFYYNADIKNDILTILEEKAEFIYNRYMKPIHK
jgi:hypothetical protein